MCMSFRRCREIVLMKKRIKSIGIFDARMRVVGCLLTFPIDLKHQISVPFVISEGSRPLLGQSGKFPIVIALFPYFVYVVRYKPVIAFLIHFHFIEICEPFGKT